MPYILNNIKANSYKILHSKILWIHIIMPLIAILVFGSYYTYSPWTEMDKIRTYIQVVAMAFPLMIAIVTTMLFESDLRAGRFEVLLSVPYRKSVAHVGNIIPLILLGLGSSVLTITGFGIVFYIMGFTSYSVEMYLNIAVIILGANVALYLIQYICCYSFGKGISLGLGILGTLLSPLMYLGIGDVIWTYIPCSYGIRLTSYFLLFHVQKMDTLGGIVVDYKNGAIMVMSITLFLFVVFLIWGKSWQGTQSED